MFSPGVQVLGNLGLSLAVPFVGLVFARRELLHRDIPVWITNLSLAILLFSFFAARIQFAEYRLRKRAHALGARVAPRIQGKLPGNIDVLKTAFDSWRFGYPGDKILDMMRDHGYVMDYHPLWSSVIMTSCPEHIQIMLASDFSNYVKGSSFQDAMRSVLGKGIFNSDGEMWKFHRAMARPFFTRDRITHFELFDRHGEKAISEMKLRMRSGYSVDFQDLMLRFTLDSATEFLFGTCVHSLKAGLPYAHSVVPTSVSSKTANEVEADTFAHAFLEAQELISGRERVGYPVWPLLELFGDKTKAPMDIVNAYIDPIIAEALEKKRNSALVAEKTEKVETSDEIGEDETLLDHLVRDTDDPEILKDETLNIMIAGRDTTAATLTFIVYFLSKHPEVMKRLREEVLSHIGPESRPSYDKIKDMKYLRAVINETLRLYPVVPFNTREAVKDTTWPSPNPDEAPIFISAGTKVPYSILIMHRRKDLWGPDAEEFDPDRFLDERLRKYLTPKPFIFLPFNAGPRICIGQQFAYNEMSFMLIRLMQTFSSFELDHEATPPSFRPPPEWKEEDPGMTTRRAKDSIFPKMGLTMYTGGGLWLKATEAGL